MNSKIPSDLLINFLSSALPGYVGFEPTKLYKTFFQAKKKRIPERISGINTWLLLTNNVAALDVRLRSLERLE